MSVEDSYNFRVINSDITSSGVIGSERMKLLKEEDYTVVINLLPDAHDNAVTGEKEILDSQNITYVYIPVDFSNPKNEEYIEFSKALDQFTNEKIHIHCAANWRVSAFYSIYAVTNGIWSKEKASQFIADIWNPKEHPAWESFLETYGIIR